MSKTERRRHIPGPSILSPFRSIPSRYAPAVLWHCEQIERIRLVLLHKGRERHGLQPLLERTLAVCPVVRQQQHLAEHTKVGNTICL